MTLFLRRPECRPTRTRTRTHSHLTQGSARQNRSIKLPGTLRLSVRDGYAHPYGALPHAHTAHATPTGLAIRRHTPTTPNTPHVRAHTHTHTRTLPCHAHTAAALATAPTAASCHALAAFAPVRVGVARVSVSAVSAVRVSF